MSDHGQVKEVQATGLAARTEVTVRRAGDGWLAVTDPTTGDVHEIRAHDAPHGWYTRVYGG